MPLTPKDILNTAIEQGRKVVEAGVGIGKRLRREEDDAEVAPTPSGSRAGGVKTGAATPGTTRTARARATGARKPAAKSSSRSATSGKDADPAKPTPRSKGRTTPRTTSSKAAASSQEEVKKAAKP